MGILSYVIVKGVQTAAKKATINAVGSAAANVISASAQRQANKDDAVVKNGKLYIKPTRSSEDYQNQNAADVVQELLGVGFESVTLKPVKKIGEFSVKKYGKIHTISINGHDTFLGMKRVPASSYIVIEYLDFKDGVDRGVYAKVNRIKPGVIKSAADMEIVPQLAASTTLVSDPPVSNSPASDSPVSNAKRFCCYCGAQIQAVNARFCASCGKQIG